jgi:hypothetical protein
MNELPANAAMVALAYAIPGDAMADALEPAKLVDIDMKMACLSGRPLSRSAGDHNLLFGKE